MSELSRTLLAQAEALDELLSDDANRYPPALAVAAATTVGLLRATAATVRDERGDDEPAQPFAQSFTGEIVTLATDAYRDGHRDGWLSCLAAHGEVPDDPATMADAGAVAPPPWGDPFGLRRMLAQTTPRPAGFPGVTPDGVSRDFPGRAGG